MKARLALIFLGALAAIVCRAETSVDVTLEDTPQQQTSPAFKRWRFQPQKDIKVDKDWKDFRKWRLKYNEGSDKPLGSTADVAAIKALLPLDIRWASRSVVVAVAGQSLYVVEKHRSKWKLMHRYLILPPTLAEL
jgi:hypothetical protein